MKKQGKSRRGFLSRLLGFLAGGLFVGKAVAEDGSGDRIVMSGPTLHTRMRKGDPPVQPLDTMLLFERGDDNNGRPMTHEVLSLIHQEKGKNSYPWTIYASLETHHEVGDACVLCSRLHKSGPGWSTGLHSEVFNHARAVALGANIEMSSDYEGEDETKVIGLNIQGVGGNRPMQYGIQIHDSGNHFEKGIGLNGHGQSGIDMEGEFDVGLNCRGNTIRVDEGTCIELDGDGRIKFRYQNGRIEFLNGEKCFAHLDVDGEDHQI